MLFSHCSHYLLFVHIIDAFWGHFIALGDRAALKAAGKLKFIIVLVSISNHVRDASETTATAILAAISNFAGGDFLAPMAGAWLLEVLNINNNNYDNLPWAILVRTLSRLVPIIFIPFLVPSGCSADKTRFDTNEMNGNDEDIEKPLSMREGQGMKSEMVRLDEDGGKTTLPSGSHRPEKTASPRRAPGLFGRGLRLFRSLSSGLYVAEPVFPHALLDDDSESDASESGD